MSGADAAPIASGDDLAKQNVRLMTEFAPPPDIDPEDEEHGLAEMYAWRDAELQPQKTVAEWRGEIEALLDRGYPYGKIAIHAGSREELSGFFNEWREALRLLAPEATPAQVYGTAPSEALAFLGY